MGQVLRTTGDLIIRSSDTVKITAQTIEVNGLLYVLSGDKLVSVLTEDTRSIAIEFVGNAALQLGTVVVIGGPAEVTQSDNVSQLKITGVVSKASTGQGPVSVTILGRGRCRVVGPVSKGDILSSSSTAGCAGKAPIDAAPGTILGIALGSIDEGETIIDILVEKR